MTTTEIEIKLRLDDPDALRAALSAAGAEREGAMQERNGMFDWPDRRLFQGDQGLRIRETDTWGEAGKLTYKGPRVNPSAETKTREELETKVADAATVRTVLERLGLVEMLVYEKRRETWQIDGCEVVLDELPQLGWFTEIEAPNEAAIATLRAKLGLENAPVERANYAGLTAEHGTESPTGSKVLAF